MFIKLVISNKNTSRTFFIILVLFSLLFGLLTNIFIINDQLYYKSFGEQLTYDQIGQFIEIKEKWEWMVYLFIPVVLLIKLFFVTVCLDVGILLTGLRIKFKQLFRVALLAESVFILAQAVQLAVLLLKNVQTLEQVQYTYPLSLLSLFDPSRIPGYLIYFFQVLSIFQLLYVFALAYGLKILLDKSMNKMVGFVFSTYGTGMFIWTVLVMFLSVQNI